MPNDEIKLSGQRRAIREHIEKYKRYDSQQDKSFALRTIRIAQQEIEGIKNKSRRSSSSWEDNWKP